MKMLTITNMWPIPEYLYYGIFVKEQFEGLNKYYPELCSNLWFINGYKSRINYILSIFQINWHLFFKTYDIIHVHFGLTALFLMFRIHKNVKIILTLHGSDINIKSSNKINLWFTKRILAKVDHIICVNEDMIKKINKTNYISIIPCGVNTSLFIPAIEKVSSIIKIVFPGNKNRSVKNYPFFRAVIDILIHEYKIDLSEVVIDNMSRVCVAETLKDADILLLTSLSEGSPQIIKEAMCCNIPIVASNVGDIAFLLNNVSNCFVIDEFEVGLFCEAILNILKICPNIRFSNGRQRIFDLGLDEKSTSMKIFNLYKSLSGCS